MGLLDRKYPHQQNKTQKNPVIFHLLSVLIKEGKSNELIKTMILFSQHLPQYGVSGGSAFLQRNLKTAF